MIRIRDAHRDDLVDSGHQVLIIAAAPVFDIRPTEFRPISRRTARIRAQDRVASLRKCCDRIGAAAADIVLLKNSSRAAVDIKDERNFGPGNVSDRISEQTFDITAVGALPLITSVFPIGIFARSAFACEICLKVFPGCTT
jgi:hypothetical protein